MTLFVSINGKVVGERFLRDGLWHVRRLSDGAEFPAADAAAAAQLLTSKLPTPRRSRDAKPENWPIIDHLLAPLVFTLPGAPRTKNSGKVVTAGRIRVIPPAPYRKWLKGVLAAAPALRAQIGLRGCLSCRVEVTAVWWRDRAGKADEDRFKVALGDALKARGGLGFLLDDDQIHWSGGCRIDVDRVRPRVDVRIEEAR